MSACFTTDRQAVEQGLDAGEGGGEGETRSRHIQAPGAVAGEPAPMREQAEAALDRPAVRDDGEAPGRRVARGDPTVQAVQAGLGAAALGGEGAVVDRLAQAGPPELAGVQRRQHVAILDRGRDHGDREPVRLGVHQRHPLASQHVLAGVVPARPANAEARDRLRVR